VKKDYTTADGKTVELEVIEEVNEVLVQFEREDKNERRNTRRRNEASIDGMFGETGWEPTAITVDIEQEYERKEELETLAKAVASLTATQQRLVQFRYYEGKTECEIAAILGINQSNVHRQLETIHKALKKFFEKFYK